MTTLKLGPTLGMEATLLHQLIEKLSKHGFWSEQQALPTRFDEDVEEAVEDFQATALGPDKKPLAIDGVVGDRTWWALDHYVGDDQKLDLEDNRIPEGITPLRRRIIGEYLHLIDRGCREEPPGSNRGPLVDTLLPSWWLSSHGDKKPLVKGPAWCCFTYMECYRRANNGEWLFGRNEGSCHTAAARAQSAGIFVPVTEGVVAVPGDLGLILRGDGTGHAVCVYRVSSDGKMINTVEGNVSNRVGIREREVGSLAGFVRADSNLCEGFERGLVSAKNAGGEGTR